MRTKLQYSLSGLFFVALIVAAIIAGYQFGEEQGRTDGEQEWADRLPSTENYSLDSVPYDSQISEWDWPRALPDRERRAQLIQGLIGSHTPPEDWSSFGGPYFMDYRPANDELSVFASREIHMEIGNLFDLISKSDTMLVDYAKETFDQQVDIEHQRQEWTVKQLAPASEFVQGELQCPDRDRILAGTYNVSKSVGFSPPVEKIEFAPSESKGSAWGLTGGLRLLQGEADQRVVTTDTFNLQPLGALSIGTSHYSWGLGSDKIVIVSRSTPLKMLILSDEVVERIAEPEPPRDQP